MEIRFGWLLDGVQWSARPHGSGGGGAGAGAGVGAAVGVGAAGHAAQLTTGPRGLVSVLLTRLGLTHPATSRAVRISQFRALMAEVGDAWYAESFEHDPWNTAARVLALRDEAIEAGWRAGDVPPVAAQFPRLHALWSLERHVVLGPEEAPTTTLSPGPADDLAAVAARLEELVASGSTWPLGIAHIDCAEDPTSLPGLWPRVFALLSETGVVIVPGDSGLDQGQGLDQVQGLEHLRIIHAPQEFSAAEATARLIAGRSESAEPLSLLATTDTISLDQALAARRLPAAANAPAPSGRLAMQVLPLFLDACTPHLDVHALVSLLSVEIPVEISAGQTGTDSPAEAGGPTESDGSTGAERRTTAGRRSIGILPGPVRREFLRALGSEAGISDDPASAWSEALARIAENAKHSEHPHRATYAALATEFCGLLAPDPASYHGIDSAGRPVEGRVTIPALSTRLDFLESRFSRTAGAVSGTAGEIRRHIAAVRRILETGYTDSMSERELRDIIAATAPAGASLLGRRTVAPWTLLTDPAHANSHEHMIWWGAIADPDSTVATWDEAEATELEANGAHILSPDEHSALLTGIRLRALAAVPSLTVIVPARAHGEATRLHPLVAPLALQYAEAHPDRFASRDGAGTPSLSDLLADPALSMSVEDLALEAVERGDAELVEAWQPSAPRFLTRHTRPGSHLLPATLSFTQMRMLITDTLSWTLRYPFGIKAGSAASVQSGNQMIGTLVHAVLEELLGADDRETSVPGPERIGEVFDRLAPRFASELGLPGRQAERAHVRTLAVESITTLVTTLADLDIQIDAIEAALEDFHLDLRLPALEGDIEHTAQVIGSIDFLGTLAPSTASGRAGTGTAGDRVVLDFKWTHGARGYRDRVASSTAMQLATYARALAGDGTPMDSVRLGYYLLKQAEFVSADPLFTDRPLDVVPTAQLWDRIEAALVHALTQVANGEIRSEIGQIALMAPPGTPGRERSALIEGRASAHEKSGRYFEDTPATYSDYTVLTGLTGDYS